MIGCGGTTLTKLPDDDQGTAAESKKRKYNEIVWSSESGNPDGEGTGGGFSEFFAIPSWQLGTVQATMRMVPDVAAHADPRNGYKIFVYDTERVIGGTSAAAALYAGLFASFGRKRGFITPELYKNQVCFNDIREGDNGQFSAMVGPDPCTGLGSPRAHQLAQRVGSDKATLQRVRRQLKESRTGAPPCDCQSTTYAQEPILAPRLVQAAVTCLGSVSASSGVRPRFSITSIVLGLVASGRTPNNTPDSTPLIGSGGLLTSAGPGNPIWNLAQSCERQSDFKADGLNIGTDILTQNITTLGRFVDYIDCCYNYTGA